MKSGELLPDRGGPTEMSSPEVEFALVLSRIISSAQNDPEELRRAIYDLARHKLREQLTDADVHDSVRTQQALEAAIQGVEAFALKHDTGHPRPVAHPLAPYVASPQGVLPRSPDVEQHLHRALGAREKPRAPVGRTLPRSVYLRWSAVLFVVIAVAGIALHQRERLRAAWTNPGSGKPAARTETAQVAKTAPQIAVPAAPAPAPPAPDPLLPKSYGVYAISNGQLIELPPLPGRAPDLRVAVSAAIQSKPQGMIPDRSLRFIVFRRDAGATAVDHPEVRVIARIGRDFSGEAKKPGEASDTWVMRNISFPFRAGPIDGRPDMYEIRDSDENRELSPGRYALVLKGQAYDFSIAGKPTDRRQCLERISSANGVFYSECSTP